MGVWPGFATIRGVPSPAWLLHAGFQAAQVDFQVACHLLPAALGLTLSALHSGAYWLSLVAAVGVLEGQQPFESALGTLKTTAEPLYVR